jgi:hypothetical protein
MKQLYKFSLFKISRRVSFGKVPSIYALLSIINPFPLGSEGVV